MAKNEDRQFAKTDMERMGIFQEMGYVSRDKYRGGIAAPFNEAAGKGKQVLPGGHKARSALQAGYFNDKFNRVMEGEAYSDPIKLRRQNRLKEGQRNIGKAFLPSNGDKKPSGLGNHYGTLSGPVSAFSPNDKAKTQYKAPGKNFYTNPGKRGTGFGYTGITLGKYQTHATDEFDRAKDVTKKENESHRNALKGGAFRLNMAPKSYFDENPYRSDRPQGPAREKTSAKQELKPFKPSSPGKHAGGAKIGTFDPYPTHSVNTYGRLKGRPVHVVNKTGKTFMPSAGPKSAPVNSIVNYNVIKSINSSNHKTLTSVMSY